MGEALNAKRDQAWALSVTAPVDQFDTVWDTNMEEYLAAGGQAIIDERTQAWEALYGDKTMLD